ncbi:MAG: caspase family protein [Marinilabiliaceae bacterium]|nr:caspase family protein [Marinilabiliaceae bacterium]
MKTFTLLFILFISSFIVFGQSAKKNYKVGEKLKLVKEYKGAIESFSKAIEDDPQFSMAYLSRAECFNKLAELDKALDDYRKLNAFKIRKKHLYYRYNAAQICYELKIYDEGLDNLKVVIEQTKLKFDAYTLKTKILIAKNEYENAVEAANNALALNDNSLLHFLKATAYEKSEKLELAESEYKAAIARNTLNLEALTALGFLQLRMNKVDDAELSAKRIINADKLNPDGFFIRSQVNIKKMDYPGAINDISQTIMLKPDDPKLYYIRGTYYQDFTQHQNAINDFSKAVTLNPSYVEAYSKRAYSYEQIANYPKAIDDYKKIIEFSGSDSNIDDLMKQAQKKLYELNKESNKPQIVLTEPTPNNQGILSVPQNAAEFQIKGFIIDDSEIASVQVNKVDVNFIKEGKDVVFDVKLNSYNIDSFLVVAADVYNNRQEMTYRIERTEVDPPVIILLNPYASDNNEIFTEATSQNLYIEGIANDDNLINTIFIDGVLASYKVDERNPNFIATINIANKNSFTVTAKDVYGNQSNTTYTINRSGVSLSNSNPMGRTWAIFIENSDYENFPSLEGPARDISLMRSALMNYEIHNVIYKKNMKKKDLEKFFAIDLRDMIKNNGVQSLLIWYAGHGKFINETGYWIPVDASREDEFSFFSTNTLKASFQSYNHLLNHTLLITDACESGPTFYQAMRGSLQERDCGDWGATKLKSSQVFTSAGYELAIDNSQFTKTFANMLVNNPNTCIPIESIVVKVTQAVAQNNQQKPQFGKIAGLSDENGTFFFINKK